MTVYYRRFPQNFDADNYAVLRTRAGRTGAVAYVYGRTTARDGGEGQFIWDATITAGDDDDGTVLAHSSGTGGWRRVLAGEVFPEWWGATTTSSNCSPAIQTAIQYGFDHGLPTIISRNFTCADTLYFPRPIETAYSQSVVILGRAWDMFGTWSDTPTSALNFTMTDGSDAIVLNTTPGYGHLYTIVLKDISIGGPDINLGTALSGNGINIQYSLGSGSDTANFLKFENVTVSGFKGGSGFKLRGTNEALLKDCNSHQNGINYELFDGFNACTLINCSARNATVKAAWIYYSYGTSWYGGAIQGNDDGIVVDNCTGLSFDGLYYEGNNPGKSASKNAFRVEGVITGTSGGPASQINVKGSVFGATSGDTVLVSANGGPHVPSNVHFWACRTYDSVATLSDGVGPGRTYVIAIESATSCSFDGMGDVFYGPGGNNVYISENNSNSYWSSNKYGVAGSRVVGGEYFTTNTTDATPAVIAAYTLTDNKSAHFTVTVTARRTGGARGTGAVGDVMTFRQEFCAVKNGTGATVATLSTGTGTAWEAGTGDLTAAGITVACTGAASGVVNVTVTGAASLTLQWVPQISATSTS